MNTGDNCFTRMQTLLTVLCTCIVIAGIIILQQYGFLQWAEHCFYDIRFQWRGTQPVSGNIVLVLMDQESAVELGRLKSSWSRKQMAAALRHLCEAGAEIIGMDMLFLSPDPDPQNDRELAGAMNSCNNIVLARASSADGDDLTAIAAFQDAMIGDGFIDFALDEDEILRRLRYFNAKPLADGSLELLPSFSLELTRTFLNIDFDFDFSKKHYLRMGENEKYLLLPYPELIINFPGDHTVYPTLSYADVVKKRFSAEAVKGKLVLIGSSLPTEKDYFSTPFTRGQKPSEKHKDKFGSVEQDVIETKDLGVACHAHAVETMLKQSFVRKISRWHIFGCTLVFGLIGVIFYLPGIAILWDLLILATGFVLIIGVGNLAFIHQHLWIETTPFVFVLLAQFVAGVVVQRIIGKRKTVFVTGLFGKYVSQSIVNELIKGNMDTALEGRHKELSILFSDLRGFTTLSEELSPKETSRLLNLYFSAMIPVVFKYQGTLDKLMGDAIMAFFGAPVDLPDHPVKAAETALDMLDTLSDLKKNNADVKGIEKLRVGIGLNSGGVTVGNLGSNDFVDYTVIGDAVNLASRLEGLNKTYKTRIILSEFCAARIGEHFLIRELDRVKVKGKAEAVTLFELVDYKYKDLLNGSKSEFIEIFHEGLEHFREQEWDAAADSFQKVLKQYPEDGPSGLYLSRIEKFRCMDLGEDWDCVTVFDHK